MCESQREDAAAYLDLVTLARAARFIRQTALRPVQDSNVESCVGPQVPITRLAAESEVVVTLASRGEQRQ